MLAGAAPRFAGRGLISLEVPDEPFPLGRCPHARRRPAHGRVAGRTVGALPHGRAPRTPCRARPTAIPICRVTGPTTPTPRSSGRRSLPASRTSLHRKRRPSCARGSTASRTSRAPTSTTTTRLAEGELRQGSQPPHLAAHRSVERTAAAAHGGSQAPPGGRSGAPRRPRTRRQRAGPLARRALHHLGQRRPANAAADLLRQFPDHPDSRLRHHSPRVDARSAPHSARRPAARRRRRAISLRRRARAVGGRHARRGHDQLHRQDAVPRPAVEHTSGHSLERPPARRRALHVRGCRHDPLPVHR